MPAWPKFGGQGPSPKRRVPPSLLHQAEDAAERVVSVDVSIHVPSACQVKKAADRVGSAGVPIRGSSLYEDEVVDRVGSEGVLIRGSSLYEDEVVSHGEEPCECGSEHRQCQSCGSAHHFCHACDKVKACAFARTGPRAICTYCDNIWEKCLIWERKFEERRQQQQAELERSLVVCMPKLRVSDDGVNVVGSALEDADDVDAEQDEPT